jgi:hypothetical protein
VLASTSACSPTPATWIPWRVVPHWRSPHPEAPLAGLAVAHLLDAGLPFHTLRNGRAIVVDAAGARVVGRS